MKEGQCCVLCVAVNKSGSRKERKGRRAQKKYVRLFFSSFEGKGMSEGAGSAIRERERVVVDEWNQQKLIQQRESMEKWKEGKEKRVRELEEKGREGGGGGKQRKKKGEERGREGGAKTWLVAQGD